MTRSNRIGLGMAVFISIGWLIVIVADKEWWQLAAWAVCVPIGLAAWIVPDRMSRRSSSDKAPRA